MFTKTKNETVSIFDQTKIGIGDVVEYNQSSMSFSKKRVAGIIIDIQDGELLICEKDMLAPYDIVREFGFPVERAAELKIIFRHPDNK